MAGFLSALNDLYTNLGDGNDTEIESSVCETKIPTSDFHILLLLPSIVMILLLACTVSRKNKCLSCFWGRPGAVFPMDILGKSNRFSYVAAWGAIAFLAADLVFGNTVIVRLEGKAYITVFNTVLSMIVIGVDYFPLFAALALESVTGYIVGTAYAWMLLGVQIYRETECDLVVETRVILIFRDLPNLLCLGYLSISLPVRTIQSLMRRTIRIISSTEMVSILNMAKDADLSPEAVHIKRLLKPVPPPPPPPSTLVGKIMDVVKTFISDWIYHNQHKFRYSARILSVMLIGLMLIYKATLELMVFVLSILTFVEKGFQTTLDVVGWDYTEGEDSVVAAIRDYTYLLYYLLINGRICFIIALSLACVGGILGILHSLSSYRTNLFALYRGDNTHIPHRSTRSNSSLLVGSMRYAGYQVAYIGWGLVLHFIILFLVALALNIIITMIKEGFYQWMLDLLRTSWPAVAMTIVIMLTQTLLAKLAFLQDSGTVLAIDNRRALFSFTFFMFFYNIFVGFLSCLLRIIKSIAIGAIFLPRLDNSALPRRFQMFDPGFANYCGFIHVECAHTHPVLVLFLRILLIGKERRKTEEDVDPDHTAVEMNGKDLPMKKDKPVVNERARMRWHLLYTLTNNPSLRVHRKSYMQYMKMLQERMARHYNLDNRTMGKLVESMNSAFVNSGNADIDDVSVEVGADRGVNAAQANWSALFGMSKLLRQIQTDMADGRGMFSESNEDSMGEDNGDKVQANGTETFVRKPKNLWKKGALLSLTKKTNVTDVSTNL